MGRGVGWGGAKEAGAGARVAGAVLEATGRGAWIFMQGALPLPRQFVSSPLAAPAVRPAPPHPPTATAACQAVTPMHRLMDGKWSVPTECKTPNCR